MASMTTRRPISHGVRNRPGRLVHRFLVFFSGRVEAAGSSEGRFAASAECATGTAAAPESDAPVEGPRSSLAPGTTDGAGIDAVADDMVRVIDVLYQLGLCGAPQR